MLKKAKRKRRGGLKVKLAKAKAAGEDLTDLIRAQREKREKDRESKKKEEVGKTADGMEREETNNEDDWTKELPEISDSDPEQGLGRVQSGEPFIKQLLVLSCKLS